MFVFLGLYEQSSPASCGHSLSPVAVVKSSRRDPALIQLPVEDTFLRRRYGSFGSTVPILFQFAARKSPSSRNRGRQPIEARDSQNPARFKDEHATWVEPRQCS